MKKLKFILLSAAALLAIGASLAGRCDACEDQQQYYRFGNSYYPAGTYGSTYWCNGTVGICTYVLQDPTDPNSFVPCRTGAYRFLTP